MIRRLLVGGLVALCAATVLYAQEARRFLQPIEIHVGSLTLGKSISLIFEGATVDDSETTLAVTDPTADRTWTIPDSASDTIVGLAATQTLTAKTLTTPVINGGTSTSRELVAAYVATGAIAVVGGTVTLGSGAPIAMTLAACVAGDAGMNQTITAISAQAHTVTVTAGFNNGGGGADVATFGGAIGDTMVIVCANAIWNVVSLRNVTLG